MTPRRRFHSAVGSGIAPAPAPMYVPIGLGQSEPYALAAVMPKQNDPAGPCPDRHCQSHGARRGIGSVPRDFVINVAGSAPSSTARSRIRTPMVWASHAAWQPNWALPTATAVISTSGLAARSLCQLASETVGSGTIGRHRFLVHSNAHSPTQWRAPADHAIAPETESRQIAIIGNLRPVSIVVDELGSVCGW